MSLQLAYELVDGIHKLGHSYIGARRISTAWSNRMERDIERDATRALLRPIGGNQATKREKNDKIDCRCDWPTI